MTRIIDTAILLPGEGFAITGAFLSTTGYSVASAGDVNGDGLADFIVGAPGYRANGVSSGAAFVIYGQAGTRGNLDLDYLTADEGFALLGDPLQSVADQAGTCVSSAGDLNGDGFDDLIVGAHYGGNARGRAYVVYGQAEPRDAVTLSAMTAGEGFVIQGLANVTLVGFSVASAGDVNGDGLDDILVGAPGDTANAGSVLVLYGQTGAYGPITWGTVAPEDGFYLTASAEGDADGWLQLGYSVSGAGDVNHDGIDDILVTAPAGNAAYVIYGQTGDRASVLLGTMTQAEGFAIGNAQQVIYPLTMSSAGDVNDDGIDDFMLYSYGSIHVIYGQSGPRAAIDLASLSAEQGFVIDPHGYLPGYAISSAGDVNGDGIDDMIVGHQYGNTTGTMTGDAYVIFGHAGTRGALDLRYLSPNDGFVIQGHVLNMQLGYSVAAAGDVNGDGFDDLLVGVSSGVIGGVGGITNVIYGGIQNMNLTGTTGNDLLTGEAGHDTITGFAGDDTLLGAGDRDNLSGGGGNDSLNGGDDTDWLAGGSGNDSLAGGAGADTLWGEAGDDVLFADALGDRSHGGAGSDLLSVDFSGQTAGLAVTLAARSLTVNGTLVADGIEHVAGRFGTGADTVVAGFFTGTANGLGGALDGGLGTDLVVLDYSGSLGGLTASRVAIAAGGGVGTVYLSDGSSRSVTLAGFETATLIGSAGDDTLSAASGGSALIGGEGNDALAGGEGNDRLSGGNGDDTLAGGAGDDVYFTDGADTVLEAADGGTDLLRATDSCTLGAGLENLALGGTADIDGTGNELANRLIGNEGANRLSGGAGADRLFGLAGADVLAGGLGADQLTGGLGADQFVFDTEALAGVIDRICDFTQGEDLIVLASSVFTALETGALAASAFVANDLGRAVTTLGRVIYETDTGRLFYDGNGSDAGERVLIAVLDPGLALTSADFSVI